MKQQPDSHFNEAMRGTNFGRIAGRHNDAFAPRSSNLPLGTFDSAWERVGDRIVAYGSIIGLLILVLALWRGWL